MASHVPLRVVLAVGIGAVLPCAEPSQAGWRLGCRAELSRPAHRPAKWVRETGGDGWGNAELEFYTDRAENARIEDGHLVVVARQERAGNREYTSARLKTQGVAAWRYARRAARPRAR